MMKKNHSYLLYGALIAFSFAGTAAAQAPDNTRVNQRDRSPGSPTADNAKNTRSDLEIMQQIRRSLMDDKSLSTYGHNVKVIAKHGRVTLKGPVHSEEERTTIEQKAVEVAGAGNVTNQLSVKAERHK
jgi:osmotically-inducible protein OsmY